MRLSPVRHERRGSSRRNERRRAKRGAMLAAALVGLGVVSMLVLAMLRSSLLHLRQARQEQFRCQAECLLEAGLDRAAYQLKQDPGYQGETWQLSAEELVGRHAGQVAIRVLNTSPPKRVELIAEYPLPSPHSVRRTRVFVVQP